MNSYISILLLLHTYLQTCLPRFSPTRPTSYTQYKYIHMIQVPYPVEGDVSIMLWQKDPHSEDIDPNFFDHDSTVAIMTGPQRVWAGAEKLMSFMLADGGKLLPSPTEGVVVELGSGVGFVGLGLSVVRPVRICVTDVAHHVTDMLLPTIRDVGSHKAPQAGQYYPIGQGEAAAMGLYWGRPLSTYFAAERPKGDEIMLILAAECVWLKELLDPFLSTTQELLDANPKAKMVLAFVDRSSPTSKVFASRSDLDACMEKWGLSTTPLAPFDEDTKCQILNVFRIPNADVEKATD